MQEAEINDRTLIGSVTYYDSDDKEFDSKLENDGDNDSSNDSSDDDIDDNNEASAESDNNEDDILDYGHSFESGTEQNVSLLNLLVKRYMHLLLIWYQMLHMSQHLPLI